MDASHSKPSISSRSTTLLKPHSPPIALVHVEETRDGAGGASSGVLTCIPLSEATGPSRKRLHSALSEDGGDAKRIKDLGKSVVSDTAILNDNGQFQLASDEPKSLLFSCQPSRATSGMVLCPSTSTYSVQPTNSLKLDGAKHKIFLSHAGAQKDFVEQLCVDLERVGYMFPFFDQRQHSLPQGEDFGPLIIEAARLCHVAVVVLSEEFLCSKWPMIELVEFYGAQQGARGGDGGKLKFLPLFFKLSVEEVKDEGRWMPKWKEHAAHDNRIDLAQWSAAVKALCKSNGLDFGKVARKEVAYRKCVLESIFKLSPPNLLFGTFEKMVGCGRMCEAMSTQFVEDTNVGAQVLGVYGMAGLGKTMLAKALHDYFYGEFLGKVCYVDMRTGLRVQRQKKILKMLCDFEKHDVNRIGGDIEKGLMQIKSFMKRNRVFLILDNLTNDTHLMQEVQDYLRMGFHPESRIMITSSSKAILEDLLPNVEFYMPMPTLMVEEAGALFLQHTAPMKALSELTRQEQSILGICIKKCWFSSPEGGFYHPMALTALADFFSRLGRAKGNQLLVWKDHLEKETDLVKDVLKSSKDLFGILSLQFSTFNFSEKLLFLDLALYFGNLGRAWPFYGDRISWICRVHDESPTIIKRKLWDLRKSGMIEFESIDNMDYGPESYIRVPQLYRDFAEWYATDHNVNGLKNAFGVFQLGGMNMRGDSSTPMKSWSNLMRLQISHMTLANARLIASKRMQELSNLGVLQLHGCRNLTMLNLEGLHCLRDLELWGLSKLETITLSKNLSENEYSGIYDSLQHVRLLGLPSLIDVPNLRACTSLHSIVVNNFQGLRSLEGADCPSLKSLTFFYFSPDLFESLLDFGCLQSLEYLIISVDNNVDGFDVYWERKEDESDVGVGVTLEGEGPCAKFLEDLCQLLYRSNSMICTFFELQKEDEFVEEGESILESESTEGHEFYEDDQDDPFV